MRRWRGHEDKKNQTLRVWVTDTVWLTGGRDHRLAGSDLLVFLSDLNVPSTFESDINFVGALMGVNLLRLIGFQAIEIAEESRSLEEADLSHFLGRETARF